MFSDGYFSISFAELIGFAVTVIGLWYVVKQLRETRMATQIQSVLAITELRHASMQEVSKLNSLVLNPEWNQLSDEEAHAKIVDSELYYAAWLKAHTYFEMVGVLVKRKSLSKDLAYDLIGSGANFWWKRLGNVERQRRIVLNEPSIGENWEWLATEFENYSR